YRFNNLTFGSTNGNSDLTAHSGDTFEKGIAREAGYISLTNNTVHGDVVSRTGGIQAVERSQLMQNVKTETGAINLAASQVGGNVITKNGRVTLTDTTINGHVISIENGDWVKIRPGTVVEGDVVLGGGRLSMKRSENHFPDGEVKG